MEEKSLRNGYTTGSCAAAAAKAAALYLLTGSSPERVTITLPDTEKLDLPVEKENSSISSYRVQKDSGDDPDVTDKTFIYASCRKITPKEKEEVLSGEGPFGKGYLMEGEPRIFIDGGPGIGVAEKDGLSCPAGHYAINPAPREQIACEVREVCAKTGCTDDLLITISAPEGEALAGRTFNPKLGITGGISILGTSGIVRPMSEAAIVETIRLELHMRAVAGDKKVLLIPGNYGEAFLKERFGIPEGTAIQISNFVRDSVTMACDEGFSGILFAGHIGKLIKVAAGFPNTHSRYGDKRMETFLDILDKVTVSGSHYSDEISCTDLMGAESPYRAVCRRIAGANTTDEALSILAESYPASADVVISGFLNEVAGTVKHQMEEWSGGKLSVEVIVFSRDGSTGTTAGVMNFFPCNCR